MRKSVLWFSVSCLLGLASLAQAQDKVYYRYTNDEGVQVLEDRIPPKYVPKGYEVVSMYGEVLRTVPPAPSDEELETEARERQARQEREAYEQELKRRYSTVKDIEDAKRRSLAELQGNISILESNLSNVRLQIRDLESRAARLERSGQEVPESVLVNLGTLKTEVQEIQAQIRHRQEEYDEVADKFDQDIEAFAEIRAAEGRR
ncbi:MULTISPECIES: hypothetical protein [unclassified Marinimicrobium]|jgi:uncharacterized protein YeaO (DUF488 family)|uniref:hypothetical protein n=1 Tax=unclassified Marinimicrobium TaxID=2632100 RepID=UPI000C668CEE|nr:MULTISPECIES: hypothetical protein [unclassified Marinimicrobium]MAN51316.1 hypothetical protein [Marinimicrobium sp.]